ncbi:MAG: hypothetical protein WB715_26390 [Roseiarcus sp.]|uniref:hypothetical protein n=1 Tax=Roseiarcus sp. TaxID=1969460 RepID=UPI003C61C408
MPDKEDPFIDVADDRLHPERHRPLEQGAQVHEMELQLAANERGHAEGAPALRRKAQG